MSFNHTNLSTIVFVFSVMGTKKSSLVVGYNWQWIGSGVEVTRPSMCLYHNGGKKHLVLMLKSQVRVS